MPFEAIDEALIANWCIHFNLYHFVAFVYFKNTKELIFWQRNGWMIHIFIRKNLNLNATENAKYHCSNSFHLHCLLVWFFFSRLPGKLCHNNFHRNVQKLMPFTIEFCVFFNHFSVIPIRESMSIIELVSLIRFSSFFFLV